MKKKISMLLAILLFFTMTAVPEFPVYAASLSIAVSNSDLKIGDTCSVTITVPNGGYAQVSLSYDSGVLSTDGGALFNISPNDSGVSQKTITFKAVGAGSASISANSIEAVDADENPVSYGAAGASVSVANKSGSSNSSNSNNNENNTNSGTTASGDGNTASGEQNGNIDTTNGDNSLSALSISGGTLSPAFSYKVTNYTAEVPYNVTSVAVSATPSNPSATVVSVTGNEDLSVGANTITIVVKAGNGVTATYTITVTRKSEEDSDNEEDNSDDAAEDADNAQTRQFTIGGKTYTPAEEIPEAVVPADFTAATVAIDGKDYACLNYAKADITLLYMTAEGEEGGSLFIYKANDGSAYPFVQLTSGSHYIIVLLPDESMIPSGYSESALQIEGKGQIAVYQKENAGNSQDVDNGKKTDSNSNGNTDTENPEDDNSLGFYQSMEQMLAAAFAPERVSAAELPSGDFYLLYALNDQGETYWYQYDNTEETYQRYAKELPSVSGDDENADSSQDAGQIVKLKQKNRYLVYGMIFGAAVLLIIIINLLIARKDSEEEDDDDEDDEDSEDEDDELIFAKAYRGEDTAADSAREPEADCDEPDSGEEADYDEAYSEEEADYDEAYGEEEADYDEVDSDDEADYDQKEESEESPKPKAVFVEESYEPENLDNTISLEAAVKAIQTMAIPSADGENQSLEHAPQRVQPAYKEENVRVEKRSRMDKFLDKGRKNKSSRDSDDDEDLEFLDIK